MAVCNPLPSLWKRERAKKQEEREKERKKTERAKVDIETEIFGGFGWTYIGCCAGYVCGGTSGACRWE
jgi:hypothetical protein